LIVEKDLKLMPPAPIQLRKWDDAAKVVGLGTPGLDVYRQMAIGSIVAWRMNWSMLP
jgi:hypothetical protein